MLAAVLYLAGEHLQRYARMRTSVCAVSFATLWLLHFVVNMKVLAAASRVGSQLMGAGSVCGNLALAFAFQVSMPLMPGRVVPDMAMLLAAAALHVLGSSYVLEANDQQRFVGSLAFLLLIAPALFTAELYFPCIDSVGRGDEE